MQLGTTLKLSAIILVAWLAQSCDGSSASTQSASGSRPEQSAISATVTACDIALAPHTADTAADEADDRIIRYQGQVGTVSNRQPQLERLGWAFVSKARRTQDPGFHTLALQTAECMLAEQADDPPALLLKGHTLRNLHRFGEAEATARRLVALRGNWSDHGLYGDTLLELGRVREAADAYQAMMDLRPGPEAYARAAQVRWLTGDLAGAVEMMHLAVRSTSPRQREPLAWALTRLAFHQRTMTDDDGASASVQRALSVLPRYPPALLLQGELLLTRGELSEAVATLTVAEALNPLPSYQWPLIEALELAHRRSEAASVHARLHETGAREDRRSYALFLSSDGTHLESALALTTAELESRQDVFTLDAHAWAQLQAGATGQARQFSDRALTQGTQDARLFYHAGVIRARAGDSTKALHWLMRAESMQNMLMPSERARLREELAALAPLSQRPAASVVATGTIH